MARRLTACYKTTQHYCTNVAAIPNLNKGKKKKKKAEGRRQKGR
jgi:hypothetical protein